MFTRIVTGWLLVIATVGCPVVADTVKPLFTEKQTFTLDSYTTFGGETISPVKVGWESYGELNEKKDNVILITHYFSGTSHAAGKYSPQDESAGYWDAIIGPGKAIDTNKYFVISVDTLVNLNAYDDNVITTGPATINPQTGQPYGTDFPVVTIRDFVNVQKALLESLGISRLHAVVGPSMGSMQAIEWASAYPDWVERMVSVIGSAESDAWSTAALAQWGNPIRLDPNWQQGHYTKDAPPTQGLVNALMLITQHALYPDYFNRVGETLGYKQLEQAPLKSIMDTHSIVEWLTQRAQSRAAKMDANHLLYLVRACQLFVAGHGKNLNDGLEKIQAKTLFLPASTDLLLMPYMAKGAHDALSSMGKPTQYAELEGELGHLEGVVDIQQQSQRLASFLTE
ncbi:E22 family MetX-like putative esterase [Alteromonas halophila]|uniref:Probable acyltransferase n=1 Tax=Alteromonas halophila TaxID=516698 RepID=A0A918JDA1_9ALTE|nr:homoserine O-acetyltransferase [Alteromonas halophila]GGW75601.1 homoserine O-acetyltransferase [Alteromonas halophila]